MKKLYEEISIDIWLQIAKKIKKLKFDEKSEKEFYNNLKKLVKMLSNTELDLTTGARAISNKDEIGLSILLHKIYQMDIGENEDKGLAFYKKISELLKLGVKTIEFLPVEFHTEAVLEQVIKNDEVVELNKIFTDGEFDFYRYGKNVQNIKIGNLKNANYILKIDMRKNQKDNLVVVGGSASLRNFNGSFPTIKEVKRKMFPEIDEAPQKYFFDTKPILSRQTFEVIKLCKRK